MRAPKCHQSGAVAQNGGGAREHAIAWKLRQSPLVDGLYVAPGNAGTAAIATNLGISAADIEGQVQAAREHGVDLTVVGPAAPLAGGIVDCFQEQGLDIFIYNTGQPTIIEMGYELTKPQGRIVLVGVHLAIGFVPYSEGFYAPPPFERKDFF